MPASKARQPAGSPSGTSAAAWPVRWAVISRPSSAAIERALVGEDARVALQAGRMTSAPPRASTAASSPRPGGQRQRPQHDDLDQLAGPGHRAAAAGARLAHRAAPLEASPSASRTRASTTCPTLAGYVRLVMHAEDHPRVVPPGRLRSQVPLGQQRPGLLAGTRLRRPGPAPAPVPRLLAGRSPAERGRITAGLPDCPRQHRQGGGQGAQVGELVGSGALTGMQERRVELRSADRRASPRPTYAGPAVGNEDRAGTVMTVQRLLGGPGHRVQAPWAAWTWPRSMAGEPGRHV